MQRAEGDQHTRGGVTEAAASRHLASNRAAIIEHRLFAFISQNWRATPLLSYAVILSLIAATTTTTGLTVESYLDTTTYPVGISVSDQEMAALRIERDPLHGELNYTILPRTA